MTKTNNIQYRGICQVCGNQQAVKNGRMSNHGYTVDHGYFNGVCNGHQHAPVQQDITVLREIQARVRKDCAEMVAYAERLKTGAAHPATVEVWAFEETANGSKKRVKKHIPWAAADSREQTNWVNKVIFHNEQRARAGFEHANMLDNMVAVYHGQPLTEVVKAEKAAPILKGEKRKTPAGETMTVTCVDGARVYWTIDRDGKALNGWKGAAAWRKMEVIA